MIMPHFASLHLGLHCLPKNLFTGFSVQERLLVQAIYKIICYCKFRSFCKNFITLIALKDIFAMLKICNWGMTYLHRSDFTISCGFYFHKTSNAKFCENKTLAFEVS